MATALDPNEYLPNLDEDTDNGLVIETIDESVGRGIFATTTFQKGQTLFRESPLVSCQYTWNEAYLYKACHYCMEPLETAQENARRLSDDPGLILSHHDSCCDTKKAFHVKCPDCSAEFCSKACLEEAWNKWHKTLCSPNAEHDPNHPFTRLIEIWKNIHYPPETVSISLFARILASVAQNPDLLDVYMGFMHDTVNVKEELAHKLLGQEFRLQLETLRQAFLALFPQSPVQSLLTPDGFTALFAMVGRNGQGIGTSPFSQWVKNVETLTSRGHEGEKKALDEMIDKAYSAMDAHAGLQFLDNEGSGLFRLQSLLNHSCEPNAKVEYPFNNHDLVVNALRRIEPGEQILISYLDECDLNRGRHSRRKTLSQNYVFLCGCAKCTREEAQDPGVTSEEEMSEDESV